MRSRRTVRRIVAIILLVLALIAMLLMYLNYRASHKVSIKFDASAADNAKAPEYLYSFSGPDSDLMRNPVGVLVDGIRVYVSDSDRHVVDVFDLDGHRVNRFGADKLQTPMYMAKNPKDSRIYVADRGARALKIFTADGKYVGDFNPKLPKSELPKFDTGGIQWQPIGVDFGSDGSMYVTEILNGHRLLVFGPDGKFKKSSGTAGFSTSASSDPEVFQFPTAVKVLGKEVWVSDSNNRRMQVFDRNGKFLRIVPTAGLPRGFAFLNPFKGEKAGTPARFVIVDTLAHDITIWNVQGKKLVNAGQNGQLEGQFSYPNDLSVAKGNKIYVTDTQNARVQVWGWPAEAEPIPLPRTPLQWLWCLLPLLFLPLLLLLRRRVFLLTPDFAAAMIEAGQVDVMNAKRRRWIVYESDLAALQELRVPSHEDQLFLDVVTVEESAASEFDAKAIQERLELSHEQALRAALAQRAKNLCTEDSELRRVAKMLEIKVYNRAEFLEKFAPEQAE